MITTFSGKAKINAFLRIYLRIYKKKTRQTIEIIALFTYNYLSPKME